MHVVRARRRFRLMWTGVICLLAVLNLTSASASSANISHAYQASESLTNGSIVSLDADKSDYVQAADSANGARLVGVVVASNDSLLAVDPDKGKVQVATSGTATVAVSTLNGDISVGDQIAVSPFRGIGMKAAPGSHIIGLAQTGLDDTVASSSKEVRDKNGRSHQINVGYIRLNIAIGTDSLAGSSDQLNSLQKLAKGLTGKTVSTTRVVISLVVAVVALVALITLVYSSIYGSIISIGRNPLAKYAVFRTLGSVLGMAVLTAGLATLTIFFLLH